MENRLGWWSVEDVGSAAGPRQRLVDRLAVWTVGFVWLWHGLVPKLLGPHPDELAMMRALSVPESWRVPLTLVAGVLEMALGVLCLFSGRRRWPFWFTIGAMAAATVSSCLWTPEAVGRAFGPISTNVQLAALAAVALVMRPLPPATDRKLEGVAHGTDTR